MKSKLFFQFVPNFFPAICIWKLMELFFVFQCALNILNPFFSGLAITCHLKGCTFLNFWMMWNTTMSCRSILYCVEKQSLRVSRSCQGSFTLSKSESEHIKFDSMWTHLEAMCLSLQYKRSLKLQRMYQCKKCAFLGGLVFLYLYVPEWSTFLTGNACTMRPILNNPLFLKLTV